MIVPNLTEEMVETILEHAGENLERYMYEDSWMMDFLKELDYRPEDSRLCLAPFKFDFSSPDDPSKTDYNNAVMLYEATLKDMAVFVAASGAFWDAMVHANLEYMRYRWPLVGDSEKDLKTIEARYLMEWVPSRRERERNGLSRLWWIVYLTVSPDDESLPDKYALTREIMSNQDIMANILDRDQFNPAVTRCFAKLLMNERLAGRPLSRKEVRAVMKHIFVLDRAVIIYAFSEEKLISKLTEYLGWYRQEGIHLEDET